MSHVLGAHDLERDRLVGAAVTSGDDARIVAERVGVYGVFKPVQVGQGRSSHRLSTGLG